ncbi:MAG: methionyl-tRNA formyltransferase [Bacteroidales bacterium]|nr:methionyl-tRNA formyltransferase [Bacteroidales bacterium]
MKAIPSIVFYGTPEFAAGILDYMLLRGIPVTGVVTAPDKPAGRGRKPKLPPVKQYAIRKGIPVVQPLTLKDPAFLEQLNTWKPGLQVVVAFRMLPEVVWNYPRLGTFNLHASLLPQYRGAAPIQWALINGETETGVTTFFINHEIDTGRIILQEKVPILPDDNAGTLTEKLMKAGARLTVTTIEKIMHGQVELIEQEVPDPALLKKAPKIKKDDLLIDWNDTPEGICNRVRAFSPYPGARTRIQASGGQTLILKIFSASPKVEKHNLPVRRIVTDGKTFLDIAVQEGFVSLKEVQLEGRKRMNIQNFLRGIRTEEYHLLP